MVISISQSQMKVVGYWLQRPACHELPAVPANSITLQPSNHNPGAIYRSYIFEEELAKQLRPAFTPLPQRQLHASHDLSTPVVDVNGARFHRADVVQAVVVSPFHEDENHIRRLDIEAEAAGTFGHDRQLGKNR